MTDSIDLAPTGGGSLRPEPLESERVVLAAPMSFTGSLARIAALGLTSRTTNPYGRVALATLVVLLVSLAWLCILAWYTLFGLFLVPYRLVRRSQRKEKRDALMHREQLAAIERRQD